MAGYVLIVESDPDLQKRIGDALREARYELASETDATWARRSVAVRTPDAVVLDTKLTDGDGFRLAEQLRRDPDTRDVPIFFVASHFRGAAHRAEARRRFAPAEYLPTPLDVNRLLALLLEAAPPGAEGRARPAAPDASGDVTPPPVPAVPAAALTDPEQERERRNVERSAKTLAADKPALQGTLRRMPFPRLLQRLYAQRASGSLLMLRDETKKIVSFSDGYPVAVRSNVLGECLGQILLAQKLIDEKALAQSVNRMQREKRQQGQILIEMGALSPYNLQRALVEQAEAKLFEIFSWRDGKFMFKEGGESPREAMHLDRSPAATILEGIRRHYDIDRQRAVLEGYVGQYVALIPDPVLRLQDMTDDTTELAFIRSVDGTERLESVLDRATIPRDKARLLLVALSEAGMIRHTDADPSQARRKSGLFTPGAVELPGAVAGVVTPPPSGPLTAGPLSMVLQTVRTQDYFWALGVEHNATAAEVGRAYDVLARTFHADRYRNSSEEDRRMAQEIFDRLAEANRVLQDPARRRAYVGKLGSADEPAQVSERPETKAAADGAASSASNAAARGLYDTGLEHLRAERHHEAVESFRQAARLVPNEAEYRAALGWALFREAPTDARAGRAALAELRRALQLDARNVRAYQYLAQLYAQTGQAELAINELERLLAIEPGSTEAAEELRRLRAR
jgi:CheY-like chemotaxis protein